MVNITLHVSRYDCEHMCAGDDDVVLYNHTSTVTVTMIHTLCGDV